MAGMSQDTAADFDWVGAQAQCTARSMFERLRTEVREDVEKRNGLFQTAGSLEIRVLRRRRRGVRGPAARAVCSGTETTVTGVVTFVREGSRIHVQGEDVDVDFVAVVTLDASGACRFVVGEAVYSDWEIRRMALELLFFEESGDDRVSDVKSTSIKVLLVQAVVLAGLWLLQQAFL